MNDEFEVKKAALELIREDARFIYALIDIQNSQKEKNNFFSMALPYLGIFADGAEQWFKKVGINAPQFNQEEKKYYTHLRVSHKILEEGYETFKAKLEKVLKKSDDFFREPMTLAKRVLGYDNVGVDLFHGNFCGNTLLVLTYLPNLTIVDVGNGEKLKKISEVAGKLAGFCGVSELPVFKYKPSIRLETDDYNFYKRTPLNKDDALGLVLFSIVCLINYIIIFLNEVFIEEIPQKLKYAYLLYYYLCDFIEDMNDNTGLNIFIDRKHYCRDFRNCLSHYGLGQYMKKKDIRNDDLLKGLTQKAFKEDYYKTKECIYKYLNNLVNQIGDIIF